MRKDNRIEELLDKVSMSKYGRKRSECIAKNICVDCTNEATEFADKASKEDYFVTGLCQKCQDQYYPEANEMLELQEEGLITLQEKAKYH